MHELANGKLSFFLRGEKLKGSFALVRTSTTKQWLLIKHKDRFAQQNDVLARAQSVLSGRTVDDPPAGETVAADGRRAPRPHRARRDDAEDDEPDARGDRRCASLPIPSGRTNPRSTVTASLPSSRTATCACSRVAAST